MKTIPTVETLHDGTGTYVNIDGEVDGLRYSYQLKITEEGLILDAVHDDPADGEPLTAITAFLHDDYFGEEDE